jgi:hypothetical protein
MTRIVAASPWTAQTRPDLSPQAADLAASSRRPVPLEARGSPLCATHDAVADTLATERQHVIVEVQGVPHRQDPAAVGSLWLTPGMRRTRRSSTVRSLGRSSGDRRSVHQDQEIAGRRSRQGSMSSSCAAT